MRLFAGTVFSYKFTFHYVSIKSAVLSLPLFATGIFTFHYVSIKSIMTLYEKLDTLTAFTFHYVSIKSAFICVLRLFECDLHSTMYLLNRILQWQTSKDRKIYIPLCIY